MTTENHLEELLTLNLETVQPSTFLEPLTTDQSTTFSNIILHLVVHTGNTSTRKANLVFRGESLENLSSKLSSKKIDDKKIPELLFYFGDKAKDYYQNHDYEAKSLRLLQNIEDTNEITCKVIFEKIKAVLYSSKKFRRSNKNFSSFFETETDNLSTFIAQLAGDQTIRDYYLYLLHAKGVSSVLVSTSLSYDAALKFGAKSKKQCVIYYVVPEPIKNFAVSHLLMEEYEKELISRGMPTYKNKTLYPEEYEVAIRGALFSCFILGLRVDNWNKFIVNPHLFSKNNKYDSIITGLDIDQNDIATRLVDTGYKGGVCTQLDGRFKTLKTTK
ncbi:MAG: hypothetical protein WCL46_06040 [Chlorobium sp.]